MLPKLGRALAPIVESLTVLALLGFAFWTVVRAVGWLVRQILTRWRTCLALIVIVTWLRWWGSLSLTVVLVTLVLIAVVWQQLDAVGFDW